MLRCPVRSCLLPLGLGDRQARCDRGHSFDIARSGYLNLLQPQDRRSANPGDSAAAVAARRRLHDRGFSAELLRAVSEFAQASPEDVVLDAGCGEGYFLGNLSAAAGCRGDGIDLSVAAVDAAAKRYPHCRWIVANADRVQPYDAASFSLVLSITGRRNPAEFRRVLAEHGRLLLAIPSPEDLIELRGQGRDRRERTIEEFSRHFDLAGQARVTRRAELDKQALHDLRLAIYRPMGQEPRGPMTVTFGLDILLFRGR